MEGGPVTLQSLASFFNDTPSLLQHSWFVKVGVHFLKAFHRHFHTICMKMVTGNKTQHPTCVVTEAAAAVDSGFWVTAGKGGPVSADNECATALCRNMADTKLLRRLGGLTLTLIGVGGVGVGETSAGFTRDGSVALGMSDNTLHK